MLIQLLFTQPVLFFILAALLLWAFTFHEFSHGYAAYLFGDDTAKRMGRLTLNPIPHLHPVGTIMILLVGFGWGNPVPVDFHNLKNPRRDGLWIAAAGPASNLLTAFVMAGLMYSIPQPFIQQCYERFGMDFVELVWNVGYMAIYINLILAIFNLLPFFPLDGEKIVLGLAPERDVPKILDARRYGMAFIIGIFALGMMANVSIVQIMVDPIARLLVPVWSVQTPVSFG